jgi:hypothetical protein
VKVAWTHTAYGIVGAKGLIGKIYSKTYSHSVKSHTAYRKASGHYAGGAVYTMSVAKATATYGKYKVTVTDI